MPVAIKRFDVGYNDTTYTENIASATAIRNIVKNNSLDILKKVVPENSFSTILEKY